MKNSKSINGSVPRTLSQSEIEEKLDNVIREKGEAALNNIRNDIRPLLLN